jgi:hypothetical protein
MEILEDLFYKVCMDRGLEIDDNSILYAKGKGLEVKLENLGIPDQFSIKKDNEALIVFACTQVSGTIESMAIINFEKWAFHDYLVMLRNDPWIFSQEARRRFENYLDKPLKEKPHEIFEDVHIVDLVFLVDNFFPPQKYL